MIMDATGDTSKMSFSIEMEVVSRQMEIVVLLRNPFLLTHLESVETHNLVQAGIVAADPSTRNSSPHESVPSQVVSARGGNACLHDFQHTRPYVFQQ